MLEQSKSFLLYKNYDTKDRFTSEFQSAKLNERSKAFARKQPLKLMAMQSPLPVSNGTKTSKLESVQLVMSPDNPSKPYAEKIHATKLINNPIEGRKAASLKADLMDKAKKLQNMSSSPQKL